MVGKSDFNENPVVSLDLDFRLRLRVCQFLTYESLSSKQKDAHLNVLAESRMVRPTNFPKSAQLRL